MCTYLGSNGASRIAAAATLSSSCAPNELVLESHYFGAETANQADVFGDVMVHVQGVARGVGLDVLGAVGVLERVERFFERR